MYACPVSVFPPFLLPFQGIGYGAKRWEHNALGLKTQREDRLSERDIGSRVVSCWGGCCRRFWIGIGIGIGIGRL